MFQFNAKKIYSSVQTKHHSFDKNRENHGFLIRGSELIARFASGSLENQKRVWARESLKIKRVK